MLTELERKERGALRSAQWRKDNPKWSWAQVANNDARKRAKLKNIPFEISANYIVTLLTDTCPIYGIEFKWAGNGCTLATSPSIDRINPDLGYVEGNIVVISIKANRIKSAYKAADLYKVADWLYEIENKG